MRIAWRLAIALFLPLQASAQPQVQIDTRLSPAPPYQVGSTLRLEVDLLTNTWFTQAPQPADLQLAGALVSPPNGQADKLTVQRDGETYFGLRLSYLISPTEARDFRIAPLTFQLHVGQGQGVYSVRSAAVQFSAQPAPHSDLATGAQGLLLSAQNVRFSQVITPSATPLKVGDSLTRQLRVEADGAQAMLIPPAEFAQLAHLKAYPQPALVSPLSNGRGAISGGSREDSISYVIEQPGQFQLPAMQLQWWDSSTATLRSAALPAVDFQALARPPAPAAFDLQADLQRLGRGLRIKLSTTGVLLIAGGGLLTLLLYLGRSQLYLQGQRLRAWQRHNWNTWRSSEACAWRQLRIALCKESLPLPALYRWLERTSVGPHLDALKTQLPAVAAQALENALQQRYAASAVTSVAPQALYQGLRMLRRKLRKQARQRKALQALRPLNP